MRRKGFWYAAAVLLLFLFLMLLALGGIWLYHAHGDFYSALQGQLSGGFYLSAGLLLIFASVLYTPFSYGVSNYFIHAARGEGRFRQVFFLFRRPLLLTKATVLALVKKYLIWVERLFLLLMGALAEVALFFAFLVVTGDDVFAVRDNPFRLAAEFMLGSPWLIGLSIALWCGVLLGMLWIYLRYILCKYVLLKYPDAGILQILRIGRGSMHFGSLLRFLTARRSFSVYAMRLVEEGWREYCRKRSLR
ncbi:MAG: hypothetical protein IJ043_07825 [Clostridia bacterium]|nr:hypothetical protein [Clostridia bacterium]